MNPLRPIILAGLILAAAPALAQQFPLTMPPNSVYGRLDNASGPGQAIPFAVLSSRLIASTFAGITALTGDVTASGPGSAVASLRAVNINVGGFGGSTGIPSFNVNSKGLITAVSVNPVIAPAGTLTGVTLAPTVVNSSLTGLGTITTGVWNAGSITATGNGSFTGAVAVGSSGPFSTYKFNVRTAADQNLGIFGPQTLANGVSLSSVDNANAVLKGMEFLASAFQFSTGDVTLPRAPSSTLHAATKGYVDTAVATALPLAGGTMSGLAILSADPAVALGAATKQYVDAIASGIQIKASVAAATTANITRSGEQTIDTVVTSTSRVLVKDQTAPAENGIFTTAAGAWTRVTDLDAWSEAVGAQTFVTGGSANLNIQYTANVASGGTIDVTAMPWTKTGVIATYTAGTGLTLSAGAFSLTAPVTVALGGSGTTTAFTAGSVLFAGASGVYAQDNANLFWDDTNNRLGIGTASPDDKLHVLGANDVNLVTNLYSRGTGGSYLRIGQSGSAIEMLGDASGDFYLNHFGGVSGAFRSVRASAVANTLVLNAGNVGVGTASPSTQLHTTGGVRFASLGAGYGKFGATGVLSSVATVPTTDVAHTPPGTGAVVRAQSGYNNDIVNVMNFGCVGDATTDDTACIQAAVTYAASLVPGSLGSPCVYFPRPSGGYLITTTITITSNVCLKGDGGSNSVLVTHNNIALVTYAPTSAMYYTTISGLGFLTDSAGSNTAGLKFTGTNGIYYTHIKDNQFTGVHQGIWDDGNHEGFWWRISGNLCINNGAVNPDICMRFAGGGAGFGGSTITGNIIAGVSHGIFLDGNGDHTITGNQFNTAANCITVRNNTSHVSSVGNECDGGSGNIYNLTNVDGFYGNDLIGGAYGISITSPTGITINIERHYSIIASISGNQNNFNPAGFVRARKIVLFSSGAFDITGFAATGDNHRFSLYNASSSVITLRGENAGSTPANRITTPGATSLAMVSTQTVTFEYNMATQRWTVQ